MARILVVDDDADILELLENLLSKEGHNVSKAPDGDSALQAFRATRFDLIITDIQMPGRHGFSLLDEVRNDTRKLPVILMTGFPSDKGVLDSVFRGAFGYVEKPFDIAYLMSLINKALSAHRVEIREPLAGKSVRRDSAS